MPSACRGSWPRAGRGHKTSSRGRPVSGTASALSCSAPAPISGAALGFLDEDWTAGDLGCGTGQLAAALAPFVRQVIAVDQSKAMLAAARRRLGGLDNVELRQGDLEALPIEDGELDAAALYLVLHYAVEPARVLAEARRALRSGGRLLVVDMIPHDREEYRQQMGHLWTGFPPTS